MAEINFEKAQIVLDDLRSQSKVATERYFLLLGAVQGAEAVWNAFNEPMVLEDILSVESDETEVNLRREQN